MRAVLDNVGFVVGAVLAIGLLYAAWRIQGTKGLLAMVAAMALFAIYRKGRTDGSQTYIEKERADADTTVREADGARIDARRRDADPSRLRDDDGFRRD